MSLACDDEVASGHEDEGATRQCPEVATCSASEQRRPELDPQCNPQLARYKAENWDPPKGSGKRTSVLNVDDFTITFDFSFGPDRAAENHITAWLEKDQDLRVQFALSVGAERRAPGPVTALILIDGEVMKASLSGADATKANSFELDDKGHATGVLAVPGSELLQGASSANLLISSALGSPLAFETFTVLNGSAQFSERSEPVSSMTKKVENRERGRVRQTGNWELLSATPPDSDGNLPLSFMVTPTAGGACPTLVHRGLVVGFLDHEAIELGELGTHPAFELEQGTGAEFELELTDLPMPMNDGKTHVLEFWWLDSDGAYTEAPRDEFSAWYDFPLSLGHVAWGQGSD